MEKQNHSAGPSLIGYYYQGCYALVILLDCDDDRATVSIETRDDVELESGSVISLKQLKHKNESHLNLKSDDIWQTIAIWCQYINEDHIHYHFVTTGIIDPGDVLAKLIRPFKNPSLPEETVEEIVAGLRDEAQRIRDTREQRRKRSEKPGYDRRWPGCGAFLELRDNDQKKLINRISITPGEFQAADVQKEVELRLRIIPLRIRGQVAERLIEWWDRRVVMGILNQRERKVENSELQEKISQLITNFEEKKLIDDFQDIPLPSVISAPPNMVRQIEWVNGGDRWIKRAKEARWRARGQRDRWLKDGPFATEKLKRFDHNLESEWRYRFEDCCDECSKGKADVIETGLRMLKWSFYKAPENVPPIQNDWQSPYLVRGTYQDMANEFKVGWHPEYDRLKQVSDSGPDSADA